MTTWTLHGVLFGLACLVVLAIAALSWRRRVRLERRLQSLEALTGTLQRVHRDAEQASLARSAFLAGLSHELRTSLQGLLGMLSLLRETGLTAHQIDYLKTATASADQLLAILNDILDLSQLEAGHLSLAPAAVDLRGLLRDVEALMRPQAMARGIALHVDADPGVPARVMADASRVRQVLLNLVGNAIKFSDRGAVVLDVRRLMGEDGGPAMLEFLVTDDGIGMDEATLSRLFHRFQRADGSRARHPAGSGLGLEISRSLARLMGGDIDARSQLGVGTQMRFRLPLRDAPPPVATTLAAADAVAAPVQPLRVLVAEDQPTHREFLAAVLQGMGHGTHFVADGEQAVAAVGDSRFDLVLMDLHMPRLDGITATRAIRALPDRQAATVPIVALTADAFDETRERCLVAGMNDFLAKPVSPQRLASLLRGLFGSAAAAEPAHEAPGLAPTPPLLDLAACRRLRESDPAPPLAALYAAFFEQGPRTVERLRAALRDAQPLELRVQSQATHAAAIQLGLAALASTAQALQEGATHLPAHEVARLVQRYEDQLAGSRQAVVDAGLLPSAVTR